MDRSAEYDRGSVAALLLVGTLVLAPVALVLGVRGLRRTGAGRRRGRWCAVAAIAGGALGLAAIAGGLWFGGWLRDNVRTIDALSVGDCVTPGFDVDDLAADPVGFSARTCDEPHLAEVAAIDTIDGVEVDLFTSRSGAELCLNRYAEPYAAAAASGAYDVVVVLDGDPDLPYPGDTYVCLLLRSDGARLTAPIRTGAPA